MSKIKDAYYFSHDSNARNDEKILDLRSKYGYEGYGIFWAIIEIMRDATGHKLQKSKINSLSIAINYDCEKLQVFIDDCINEFKLFTAENGNYYSNRLLRSMKRKEQLSSKMRANAKQKQSKSSALKHNIVKENIPKEIKEKKGLTLFKNSEYYDFSKFKEKFLSNANYVKYDVNYYYEAVKNWSAGKGEMKKDWVATARNFALNDKSPRLSLNGNIETIKLPD